MPGLPERGYPCSTVTRLDLRQPRQHGGSEPAENAEDEEMCSHEGRGPPASTHDGAGPITHLQARSSTRGLTNLGNTCYASAVIHMMYAQKKTVVPYCEKYHAGARTSE